MWRQIWCFFLYLEMEKRILTYLNFIVGTTFDKWMRRQRRGRSLKRLLQLGWPEWPMVRLSRSPALSDVIAPLLRNLSDTYLCPLKTMSDLGRRSEKFGAIPVRVRWPRHFDCRRIANGGTVCPPRPSSVELSKKINTIFISNTWPPIGRLRIGTPGVGRKNSKVEPAMKHSDKIPSSSFKWTFVWFRKIL